MRNFNCENHATSHSYCRNLKFTQAPDYTYLKLLFRDCLRRLGEEEDYVLDWMRAVRRKGSNANANASPEPFVLQDPYSRRTFDCNL